MPSQEIEEFAKLLVKYVRDEAIKSCDVQLGTDNMNSPIAKRWQSAISKGATEELAKAVIADCVDDTIFFFLLAIDQGILDISFKTSNKKEIDLSREGLGELAGWYTGEWRSAYSGERHYDNF